MTVRLMSGAAMAMVLALAPVARADDLGAVRDFRNWSVACDNARICRAYGFAAGDATIGPAAGEVCHSLMVVWYWMPGSAEAQAA